MVLDVHSRIGDRETSQGPVGCIGMMKRGTNAETKVMYTEYNVH